MQLAIDNPKEVGSDRVVNTLAAFTLYGGPSIVVDFGTTNTFDVVSERGEFLGGAFTPGIEISFDALAARAAQLRKVEPAKPRSVIGKNTVECLQSGMYYGFAGLVDRIVERMTEELGPLQAVIATGGLAPVVHRRVPDHHPSRADDHPDRAADGVRAQQPPVVIHRRQPWSSDALTAADTFRRMRTEDGGEAATDPRYAAAMAQAERLRSDLAAVRGRGTSAEGSVTAVVGASGALLELEIDLGVPACDGREVAQRVLDAARVPPSWRSSAPMT